MSHLRTSLLLLAVLLGMVHTADAQRIAFVNTKYILDQMPEYSSAQKELDRFSKQWQDEIDERHQQIKRLRDSYNAEAILLTEEMKRTRLDEIDRREREARDLQKKRFGFEGDLFKRRQELIKPIQDKVYNAIQRLATERQYDFILDKSEGITVIFADPKLDKSDDVLRLLGVK